MGARKIADFKVKGITTMNAMVRWMIASLGILVFGFAKAEGEVVYANVGNLKSGDDISEYRAGLMANPCPKADIPTAAAGTYTFEAKGELGVTKGEGIISLRFDVDKPIYNITSASIEINAYDVDYPIDYSNPEHDVVYFNNSKIGRLTGVNNAWRKNTFSVKPSKINVPKSSGETARNALDIKVDIGNGDWITQIGYATLTIKGDKYLFDAPKNLKASDFLNVPNPQGIFVTWDPVPGAKYYNVYRDGALIATTAKIFYLDVPKQGQYSFAAKYYVSVSGKMQRISMVNHQNHSETIDLSPYSKEDMGQWERPTILPKVEKLRPIYPTQCYRAGNSVKFYVDMNDFSDEFEIKKIFVTARRRMPRGGTTLEHRGDFIKHKNTPRSYYTELRLPAQDSHGEYSLNAYAEYVKKGDNSILKTEEAPIPLYARFFFDINGKDGSDVGDVSRYTYNTHLSSVPNWFRYWRIDGTVFQMNDVYFENYKNGSLKHLGVCYDRKKVCLRAGAFLNLYDEWHTNKYTGVKIQTLKALKGPQTAAMAIQHERLHRDFPISIYDGYRVPFLNDDGDSMSNTQEEEDSEFASFDFSPKDFNTYNMGGDYADERFGRYADEEIYVRVKSLDGGVYYSELRDYSYPGLQSSKGSFPYNSIFAVNDSYDPEVENVILDTGEYSRCGLISNLDNTIDYEGVYTGVVDTVNCDTGRLVYGNRLRFDVEISSIVSNVDCEIIGYLADTNHQIFAYSKSKFITSVTNVLAYLDFNGETLSQSGRDGYELVKLIVRASCNSDMPPIYAISTNVTPTCVLYKSTDFNFVNTCFTGEFSASISTNKDLEINTVIFAEHEGLYNVIADLSDSTNQISVCTLTNVLFSYGRNDITIKFPGKSIYAARANRLQVNTLNLIQDNQILSTMGGRIRLDFSYEDFKQNNSVLDIDVSKATINLVKATEEQKYNGIELSVDVINRLDDPVYYNVSSDLYGKDDMYVTNVTFVVALTNGLNRLTINVPGSAIRMSKVDGPYSFGIVSLSPQDELLQKESFTIKSFSRIAVAEDFIRSSIEMVGEVSRLDNHDGYLQFLVPVSVSLDGCVSVTCALKTSDGEIIGVAKGQKDCVVGNNDIVLTIAISNIADKCDFYIDQVEISIDNGIKEFVALKLPSICLSVYDCGLLAEGIVYQLDASSNDVNTNNFSVVTWRTTDGIHDFLSSSDSAEPQFVLNAFNNKGAIRLGYDPIGGTNASTRLVSTSALNHRTVFVVCRPTESQNAYAGLFGADESSYGILFSGTKVLKEGFCEHGELYVNGKKTDGNATFVVGEPLVITAVSDELQLFDPAIGNVQNSTNYPLRYFKGELAEIISYDRVLTKAERCKIEMHLRKKWITGVDEVAIAQEDMLVTAAEQDVGIDVVAFSEWGLVSNQGWVIPSVAHGTGTTNISLRVAANTTGTNRTAFVTVTNTVSSYTFKLVQYKSGYLSSDIEFQKPVTISASSDVKTDGELVYAYCVTYTPTVNGVKFNAGGTDAGCFSFGNWHWYGGTYACDDARPSSSLPSAYRNLLKGAMSADSLYINDLEVGQAYMVQVWCNNSRADGIGKITTLTSGANSCSLLGNSTGAYGGIGQYVIGYFVADSTRKTIEIAGGNQFINAIQLRKVPESQIPSPRIMIEDSVAPTEDRIIDFGGVAVGLSRTETITIRNNDQISPLTLKSVSTRYLEDFDSGAAEGWLPNGAADWNVVAGVYVAGNPTVTNFLTSVYSGATYSDVAVQVDVWRAEAESNSQGILLRASEDGSSGYEFFITDNGSYSVWCAKGSSTTSLQGWTSSSAIVKGGTNTVLACAMGSRLSFYINGKLVWTGEDNTIRNGKIGLAGYVDAAEARFFFDNVVQGAPIPVSDTAVSVASERSRSISKSNRKMIFEKDSVKTEEPISNENIQLNIGIDSDLFEVSDLPTLPMQIAPNEAVTFSVTFKPQFIGETGSDVRIVTDDSEKPHLSVAVRGAGEADKIGLLPIEPYRIDGTPGGPFNPNELIYTVTNSSESALEWEFVNIPEWLTPKTRTGSLLGGSSVDITFELNEKANLLVKGVYYGDVTVRNKTTSLTTSRVVTLILKESADLQLSSWDVVVTNKIGMISGKSVLVGNRVTADIPLAATITPIETGRTEYVDPVVAQTQMKSSFSGGPTGTFRIPPGIEFRKQELLVKFDENAATAQAQEAKLAALGGGEVVRRYKLVPGLALIRIPVPVATTKEMEELVQRFEAATGISYVQPNYEQKALAIPNDPRFEELYAMRNVGQTGGTSGCDISATLAWDRTTGNESVIVGVIDSGVDYNHEDLTANMWVNSGEVPGDGIDNDGNGVVDDVYGYNSIEDNGDPMDDNKHGTHCAGTIAAVGNNGIGVAGVCWTARIMALKFLDSDGRGDTANALACIEYAVLNGAKILSNSWGGGAYSYALKEMIDAAGKQGVLFVAAAGNEGTNNDVTPHYPSSYSCENIIAVLSVDHNDRRASSSCYGLESVDIAAPGVNILSCYMGGGYVKLSGTSMATPHVSGAAALLLSVNQGMTPYQIKEMLMNSGDPVAEGLCVSGKRLNVARALRSSGRWLSVSKERIENLEPGTQTDLGITFDAGWCEPGVYDGIVRFASNDQNKPVTNLTVRMVVEPDDLRVSPSTSFDVYGVEGGPFSPTSGVYRIRNASSVPVSWAVATSNSWISVSPSEGVIPGGGSQDVVVTVNEYELQDYPQGAYTGEFFIENKNNGIVQRRFANLTIRNTAGVLYVDPNRPDDSGSGRSWRSAKKTLNSAIAKAMDGATIVVTNGVYYPIDTRGKTLTIRSVNGPLETVIDGQNQAQCAILGGSKYVSGYRVFDTNVVVSGFTLRNGRAERKLVNGVYEGDIYGGGAYGGVLTNCYLIGNYATYGAGAYGCKLYDCLVARNEALYDGGGLYLCDAINCRIEYNRAERGAGMYQGNAVGCLIEHNRSVSYGGGIYLGTLLNCTVVDNKCRSYGGAGTYRSAMTNSIVWGNVRISDGATYNTDGGSAVRSCIQTPDSYYNAKTTLDSYSISSDPKFVDSDSGIYMLSSSSPCLNRGVVVDNLTSVDMLGRARVQDGAPDCGAYEGVPSGYVIAGAVDGVGLIDRRIALVESGGTARFAAIAIDRDFDSFLVDGAEVSKSMVYEWGNVTSNGKIVARFRNADIFVDANRPDDSGDGKTWMTAKRTLNGAVNAVYEGESIIVTNGIYTAVNTLGKKIVLRSVEGASKTIIDGGGTNRCANLTGTYVVTSGYGAGSTLMGFTLQNGYSTSTAGGAYYGTLVNCIVRGNKAETLGGGVYYSALTNCVIASNMANIGGGIYYGRMFNCSIVGNRANKSNSGVYGSYCRDSVIWGNRLRNCDTSDVQSGSFFNCYVENPSSMSSAIYTTDPGLVDPINGDARLRVGSPCIDKGVLQSNFPLGEHDVVMNPRVCGAQVDIGAYEGNAVDGYVISGSVSGYGGLVSNTAAVAPGGTAVFTALPSKRRFLGFMTNGVFVATSNMTFEWNNITSDGTIKAVYEKVDLYVDAKRPDDTGNGTSWSTAYKSLQKAVEEALDDEIVYVAAGVYDPIEVDDKFILIKSVSGAADTVVDGGGKTRCAKLGKATVHHSVIMDGFTFTNGFATQGAGVQYGTLTNCIIVANVASGSGYVYGGGTYYSDLYSCEIKDNVVRGSDAYAGGCYYGTRVNCVISGNTVETTTRWAYGGGVYYGTSIGCLIVNNSIKASETSSLSCYGGGSYYGTLRNCTVAGNRVPAGLTSAGVYNGSIYNSIVWENRTEANVLANHPGSSMYYSCSSPRPSGTSNINSNPLFIDNGNGNYQLQDNSPCINRGYNSYVENQVDLLGNLRIMNTTVDMGAYEWMGTVTMPVITPSDGAIFKGVAQKVTITCNTDDAIIYYTLDGSEPTRDSMIYTKAFNIKETTTIKAKAFAEQMWASKIATSKITKFVYSGNKELAEALDVPDWEVLTDTSKPWVKVGNVSSDNEDSAKCGGIGDSALSWMQTTVIGKGTLSFVWKTSCEDDPDFDDWDYVRFLVDDVEVVRKDGVDDWSVVEVRLDALKTHVLRWEYVKDSSGAEGEDCVWVDNVVWIKDPEPIPEIIKDSEVAVALEGSADAKLAANITDAAEYAAYRTWALGLAGVTAQEVKDSAYSWLSYALNTDKLIIAAPKEGDIVIDTFESAVNAGAFEFTVKLDDIEVGENALGANLRKVFDIEGAETLANGGAGFSTDNVEVNTAAPESGNVKFTVTPKMEKDQMPDSFFFRVKMK